MRDGVARVGVETGRDQHDIRAEGVELGQDALAHRLAEPVAAVAGLQRRIADVAVGAGLGGRARARKQRHFVRRGVEQVPVVPEDALRAVAVVDVEIDDRDALGAVAGAGVEAGDGDVGEQAEAHGAVLLGVVAGRANLAEGVGDAAVLGHHRIDGAQARPDAEQRRVQGSGGHRRVRVDLDQRDADGGHRANAFEVRRLMRAQDRLLDVVAHRRRLTHQGGEGVGRQRGVDGGHAFGPLDVEWSRVVLQESRMRQQQRAAPGRLRRPRQRPDAGRHGQSRHDRAA